MWSIKRRAAQAAACAPALPTQTRQDDDHAAFAGTDIGILPIDDSVTHVYFHLVSAGRDHQNLRMIVARRGLSGLHAVDEHERSRGRAGHDDLCRIRGRRFAREPTAGGKPGQ
jgi:hypothetical protein